MRGLFSKHTWPGLRGINTLTIIGVFALFGLYEYSWLVQEQEDRQSLIAQMAPASAASGLVASSTEQSKTSDPGGSVPPNLNRVAPHLMVLAGVMLICLMINWRRQAPTQIAIPNSAARPTATSGVLDTLGLGVAEWNSNGEMVACNTAFRGAMGNRAYLAKVSAPHAEVISALAGEGNVRVLSENDEQRIVEVTGAGMQRLWEERPLPEGGFVTIVSDAHSQSGTIRALEASQEQLKQMAQQVLEEKFRAEAASRAKTSFLAHLSHDVRTPLNHIIGFADLIAHQTYGPLGDKRYLGYIQDIKNSGERLLQSFSEILELAQLEGGHLVLRKERIAVSAMIEATANRFQDAARRAGIQFDISSPQDSVIFCDRICVERMLGNLVENAIQFTPSGGHVRIAGWIADDGVVIEVSDTGIGMSEERLKDLSQPFVLGDAAFARESKGVGLGIAISRAIAELSGGRLEIDSNPAVGTTVAISLPKRATQANQQAA